MKRGFVGMFVIWSALALMACGPPASPTANPAAATQEETSCDFAGTGATIAVDGKRANFACGRQGDNDVVLLGEIKAGDKGWQIERAAIDMTNKSFAGATGAMTIKAISVGPAAKP